MQQNSRIPDITSPYMIWQYVHLMTPFKTSDYGIHSAFPTSSSHAVQPVIYSQDQSLSNNNYRLQHQQYYQNPTTYYHPGNLMPFEYNSDNHSVQKEIESYKSARKIITNNRGNHKYKLVQAELPLENVRNLPFPSPKKTASFTIDAILNTGDNSKSSLETSPILPQISDPERHVRDSVSTPVGSVVSSPLKISSCSPLTSQFSIPPPLMHSTPTPYHSSWTQRRQARFLEASHPYFCPENDSNNNHNADLAISYSNHPRLLPTKQIISSSSSSTSSFGSSSISSSISTSPESKHLPRAEKSDRRAGGKSKRIRTIFTPEQLERLEAEFERQQYMVGTERFYLATSLSLTEAQVKVWFQNRRIKWRKQHLEQQQARLAEGNLYRDLEDDSGDSDLEEHKTADTLSSGDALAHATRRNDEGRL